MVWNNFDPRVDHFKNTYVLITYITFYNNPCICSQDIRTTAYDLTDDGVKKKKELFNIQQYTHFIKVQSVSNRTMLKIKQSV